MRKPTAEQVRAALKYDPVTGTLTWRRRSGVPETWNTRYAGTPAGTKKPGEIQISIKLNGRKRLYRAHHLAWLMVTGHWPVDEIDHKNGNPHDNSWGNLRLADPSQNKSNRRVVAGACPYKGVYWHAARGRYAAQIKHRKQWKWLGLHDTAEGAARAYDSAARTLHGKFASTNECLGLLPPQGGPRHA